MEVLEEQKMERYRSAFVVNNECRTCYLLKDDLWCDKLQDKIMKGDWYMRVPCCDFTYDPDYKKIDWVAFRRRHKKKNHKLVNKYERFVKHKKKLEKQYKLRPYEIGYRDDVNNELVRAFIDHNEVVGYAEKCVSRNSKKPIKRAFNRHVRRCDDIPSGSFYKKLNDITYEFMW